MARIRQIVVDCRHPASLARFWAELLDDFSVRSYDADEFGRLAALGLTPETDPTVILDGPGLELCFQRVDDAPLTVKRPLHLDLTTTDRAASRDRAVEMGAAVVAEHPTRTWMRDPEGNDFCLVDHAGGGE